MTDDSRKTAPQTDEERARAVREQLKSIHAFDLAYEMAISLVSFGYQKLGLTDETRELRDLEDARLSIELLGAVVETIDKNSKEDLTRDLHASVAQMQMSYARAVLAEGPEAADAAEAAAGARDAADEGEHAAAADEGAHAAAADDAGGVAAEAAGDAPTDEAAPAAD